MIKPDRIKRSVKATQNDRAAGDAPNIGRVARMPGTGMPKGERRKRKRAANKGERKGGRVILNWVILVGMASGILGAVGIYFLKDVIKVAPSVGAEGRLEIDANELEISRNPQITSPTEVEAFAVVKAALGVRDASQISKHFVLGEQTAEAAAKFLADLEKNDGEFMRMDWLSNMDANGLTLEGVLIRFRKEGRERGRIAFLRPSGEGGWKVDFESFARIAAPAWDELLGKKVDQAQVRVFLVEDSYYNGPFSDDRVWKCYGIGSPDTQELLQGYCKLGSAQAAAISAILERGQKVNRAMIEIQRVKDGRPSQFEITQVLAEDWVRGEKPFDQGFN